jgi:ADP-ribose pyrophosphatase
MNGPQPELRVLASTRYLRFVQRDGWDFVQRSNATAVIAIAALTGDGKLLLVEQFRPPVNARVIELPAGLVGDEPDSDGESLADAARRELLEETGYEAGEMREVFRGVTSAGMTDETITFFIASGLRRTAAGGGVAGEKIVIHEVPLAALDAWLAERARMGIKLDARLMTGVYLLQKCT